MNNKSAPEKTLQLAQQIFCANSAYQALQYKMESSPEVSKSTLLFNDLVQLVKGNNQQSFIEKTPELMKVINSNLKWRRIYMQLVQQFKFAECGMQAAASSNEILPSRITEQFTLKFKRDKNYETQVYVILSIINPAEHHQNKMITLHININEQLYCVYFPALSDGRSQLLMEDNNNTFKLLTDPNSHLYLM
jgi:hypothetical protein